MSSPNNDILERIKKLMALGESSNPNEAAIALARAQKLMQEHSISKEQLEVPIFVEESFEPLRGLTDKFFFLKLASIISHTFGLENFVNMSNSRTIRKVTFIGPKERIESACYVYTILMRQAAIVRSKFMEENKPAVYNHINQEFMKGLKEGRFYLEPNTLSSLSSKRSAELQKLTKFYMEGWAASILEKVEDFRTDHEESLALANYMDEHHPDLSDIGRKQRYANAQQLSAFEQGISDGADGFNLFRGVKGKLTKQLS